MSLHLLCTGYITDDSLSPPSYYSLDNFHSNRVDYFASMICSLQDFEFDGCDFYLSYDINYSRYESVLKSHIRSKLNFKTLNFVSSRLQYFKEWAMASQKIPDYSLNTLLLANLDHAYIAKDIEPWNVFISDFNAIDNVNIGAITHWQEFMSDPGVVRPSNIGHNKTLFLNQIEYPVGTTIVRTSFFKSWWEKDFVGDKRIVRPDNPFGPSVRFAPKIEHAIPKTELFRHLDGYGHIGIDSKYASAVRPCCTTKDDEIKHTNWSYSDDNATAFDLPSSIHENGYHYLLNLNSRRFLPLISLSSFRLAGIGFFSFLMAAIETFWLYPEMRISVKKSLDSTLSKFKHSVKYLFIDNH